ncbi:MAG TPA: cyclohexanone monooxygenase, partial [Xanthomonadales bacterium]|nr:cyclohexanone monooxygenase [Xanthomonadales bacterium]
VQVIQSIAGQVGQLVVFQRTPTYCIPQRNRLLSADDRQQIRRDWATIMEACKKSYGGFIHTFDTRSGLAVTAAEREAKFEDLWRTPGFAFWFGNFADLMMNDEVNAHASEFLCRKIRERVHDPETVSKLLPDHPFGSKRVPLENGYYEVFNRNNVHLVDLRKTPIKRMTAAGIETETTVYPLDLVIYATGFDAGTGALSRIDIRGPEGFALVDKWRDGARTFLGMLVAGFPNLFILNGPHNAAALCNAGRCIEQNVDWVARCMEQLRKQGLSRVEPTLRAELEWTEHVYETADATVLAKMTNSWFFGANTPGKPRRVTIYAGGASEYREHCEAVAASGYAGLVVS